MTRAATLVFRVRCLTALFVIAFLTSGTHATCHADDDAAPKSVDASGVRALDPPRRIDFRLHDDVRITGALSAWDDHTINGSFGKRAWTELNAGDAWALYLAIADRERASDWVNLGRIMLLMPDSRARAEQAFQRAVALDPASEEMVAKARVAAELELLRREEAKRLAAEAKLRTVSPEAGPWTSDPWPELTAEARAKAATVLKSAAEHVLQSGGLDLTPVETDLIVLYSDAPRPEAAMWVIRLERAYRRLARMFEIDSSHNIFHGKLIVFVFTDHDRYRLVEAEAFNQLVPRGAIGLCHYEGSNVFLCFHKHDDPERLLWQMIHEFTHAFMHRVISPARLPAWAHEGLAHVIAAEEMADTAMEKDRRAAALDFVRSGASVIQLLDRTYEQFDWTESWTRFTDVSGLVVELMLRDRPQAFLQWVRAVKRGKPWREALADNFGVEPREVIETAARHYMVND